MQQFHTVYGGAVVEVVRDLQRARQAVLTARAAGKRVGFVPTMGALHEGHLSLIRRARRECSFVVVSIFVNPTQFGPNEDLDRYPRPFQRDVQLCAREGVDLVFAPSPEAMYPAGYSTYVDVEGITERYEGACRPGHFRGVATVVTKLFHIIPADVAYFGQKDAQQLAVIRRMVADLNFPLEIVACDTVRDPDGLAVSSRNVYLDPQQRRSALGLSRALFEARRRFQAGERSREALGTLMRRIMEQSGIAVDYADVVDPESFEPVDPATEQALLIVAGRVGQTRLIDNLPLWTPPPEPTH